MHTAPIKIATLDEDGDLLLVPDFWQEVMEDLGSWEEFSLIICACALVPSPRSGAFCGGLFPALAAPKRAGFSK